MPGQDKARRRCLVPSVGERKADGFLVMARGSGAEVERARALLANANPTRLDVHQAGDASAEEIATASA
jgi:hypothetical protein